MKAKFLLISAAILSLVACAKQSPVADAPGSTKVSVPINVLTTKATTADDAGTKTISSIQVFVFNSGNLMAYKEAHTVDDIANLKVSLNATESGISYTFLAIANNVKSDGSEKAAIAALSDKDDILAVTEDISDMGITDVIMQGELTSNITSASAETSVSIEVKRLVAKVEIKKITCDFSAAVGLQNKELIVKDVYVENSTKKATLKLEGKSDLGFYNTYNGTSMTFDGPTFLRNTPSGGVTIQTTAGAVTPFEPNYMYLTLPNDGATKKTMLVVEATLGGDTTYYVINLHNVVPEVTAINSNYSYTINSLTIKGKGSDNPDEPTTPVAVSLSLTVADWTTGFSKDIVI